MPNLLAERLPRKMFSLLVDLVDIKLGSPRKDGLARDLVSYEKDV